MLLFAITSVTPAEERMIEPQPKHGQDSGQTLRTKVGLQIAQCTVSFASKFACYRHVGSAHVAVTAPVQAKTNWLHARRYDRSSFRLSAPVLPSSFHVRDSSLQKRVRFKLQASLYKALSVTHLHGYRLQELQKSDSPTLLPGEIYEVR